MADIDNLSKAQLMRLILKQQEMLSTRKAGPETADIAIVGMSCRFPGSSNDPDAFWNMLASGRDAVSDETQSRWRHEDYLGRRDEPGKAYSLSAGLIDDIESFDPLFFGISPREAETMDPQQRLALELSWQALEAAGIPASKLAGTRTGVFFGVGGNEYMQNCYASTADENIGHVASSNALNVIAGRVAYTLGLQGPAMAIDTACSSSLVAIHVACQSLRNGESQLAIAGGVNTLIAGETFVALSKASMLSPTGRCRTFSSDADGYVRAEGCGVVILKRLADAKRDGDHVLAVIKGSAVNQDGRSSSLTAPSGPAQMAVLREALRMAGVSPADVDYIETHGTGTGLGDPIEVQSLDAVYGVSHSAERPLHLGALKSNMGHAESASGVAALIKTVLCLQHRQIPANLHCGSVNERISADFSRLALPSHTVPWPTSSRAIAGVSSFGFSGTNAHLIVAEAEREEQPVSTPAVTALPFVFSARSPDALKQLLADHESFVAINDIEPAQLAATLALGRSHFEHRAAFCATGRDQLLNALRNWREADEPTAQPKGGSVAFLFTGQGSQQAGMGRALYENNAAFRRHMDECRAAIDPCLDLPILDVMWGGHGTLLDDTRYTQPALFALEYGLAKFWIDLGIEPEFVMGHSVGEFAAACVAGVFSLEDAARLICARGRLMSELKEAGTMLAVMVEPERLAPFHAPYPDVSVAALNGPASVVLAGGQASIRSIEQALERAGIACQPLNVSHAFHSPLMRPMLAAFRDVAESVHYSQPQIAVVSNVTGRVESERLCEAGYWVDHVMATVNFHGGMQTLEQNRVAVFLEVGPSAVLLGMGRRCMKVDQGEWLPSQRVGQCWEPLNHAMAQLYLRGADLRWDLVFDRRQAHARLPGHPMRKARYWLQGRSHGQVGGVQRLRPVGHPLLGTALPLPDSQDHLFMATWTTQSPAYFDHHRLFDRVVVPAASHVALMLLAGSRQSGGSPVELADMLFPEALTLDESEDAMVQIYLKHAAEGGFQLQLRRIAEQPGMHRVHAEGRLLAISDTAVEAQPLAPWMDYQAQHDRHIDGAAFYQSFWDVGYTLGSAFCWIAEGWQRDATVLARMALPELPDGANDYGLHPGLIDSCFQLIACCATNGDEETRLTGGRIFIPFSIDRIRYVPLADCAQAAWCVASLREKPHAHSQRVIGDISLYAADGRLVARIEGFQARMTDQNGLFRMLDRKRPTLAHELRWQVARPSHTTPLAERAGRWLAVGPRALAERLAAEGLSAIHLDPAQLGVDAADVQAVGARWADALRSVAGLAGVVVEPTLDVPGDSALLQREILRLAGLVSALEQCKSSASAPLVCLLADSAALDSRTAVQPAAAAMRPLLDVLRSEGVSRPLKSLSVHRDEPLSAAIASALALDAEHVAVQAGVCMVPELQPSRAEAELLPLSEGWYAISGGQGGLGLEIARHLAQSTATGLVLLGRSTPSAQALALKAECEAQGVPVRLVQCDIADPSALARWVASMKEEGIELCGLIHAAGVVQDQAWEALDGQTMLRVLRPKVEGTVALLHALADHPLRHVIGFSSMSAVLGTQGQAAYAVANAYLDAELHNLRLSKGVGLSLSWGPWQAVGMASRLDASVQRHFEARGIRAFDVEQGIAAFASWSAHRSAQLALIDADWRQFARSGVYPGAVARLGGVEQGPAVAAAPLDELRALSAPERREAVRRLVYTQLAAALGCSESVLDNELTELPALGVDSLIAVDLRSRLQKRLGANVAIADMMGGMSLAGLVEVVERSLGELSGESEDVTIVHDEATRFDPFPITDMQQAYWIGRTGAFELGGLSLHGYKEIESDRLDLPRFERAWRTLVQRHDMLRAIIRPSGDQVVAAEPPPWSMAIIDLRGLPAAERDARLAGLREEMSHQVLPLDVWPAFDVRASLLDGGRIRLHLSADGTFLDFRSFLILFRELALLYRDPETVLPALSMTFRDYVLTLREQEGRPAYQRSLAYWARRIETLAPAPDLPLAKKPSQVKNHRSKRWESQIPVARWEAFKSTMQGFGLTQAAVLLAVYGEVLGTWSSSPRFCINVPVFNRQSWHPDVNHVLGNFSSFTLVEFDYSVEMSFVDRVKDVQRQMMEGLQYHHVSGVQILRMINQARGKISAGAYPCVYTSLPSGVDEWDSSLKSMISSEFGEMIYTISQTPQVWIDVHVWYESGGLEFNWDAVEELFPQGLIDDMFRAYVTMIERLADEPALWQASFIDLMPAQQQLLLSQVNDTARPIPDALLQEQFYAAALAFPDHAAVIAGGVTLSYAQLRAQANAVAHQLRAEGVTRNQLVAVAMGKSVEQIVAVMGVLIAGGAYLPIDLAQPRSRIDYVLAHGGVKHVLTSDDELRSSRWPEGVAVHSVGSLRARQGSTDDLAPVQTQTDLAYVLYTSGSTGRPKGVMISHRNVVNMVEHTNTHFHVRETDRLFNITALTHDLSVYDIFGALQAGAAIVMPDEDKRREPLHWLGLMQAHCVSMWNSVPALMDMLLESVGETEEAALPAALPDLRVVILGGDWVAPALPGRIHTIAPNADLLSIGGPTETTVWNIWNPMNDARPDWISIPYGKPISNSRYFILGHGDKPAPVWVTGELCCAGECLAQGYLGDAEITQASFVQHPITGERIYRTGDLGRYLPDGRIEFIGRRDFQMKIRGQRIEAGEIEHALLSFPGVENAAVVATGEGLQRQLVAHVAIAGQGTKQTNKSADFLSEEDQRDVITDPVARLEFTLAQKGLRRFGQDTSAVALARGESNEARKALYLRRQSFRQYDGQLTLDKLAATLDALSIEQLDGQVLPKYRYPSAGGLNPVQCYVFIKPGAIQGVEGGYYYHDPARHELVFLNEDLGRNAELYAGYLRPLSDASAFSVFLVADLAAIRPMYGKVARDFCMIEAGYIGQLLMSQAVVHGIGLCPVGGVQPFEGFREALRLGDDHEVIHSFTGGAISQEQLEYWLEKPKSGDSDEEHGRDRRTIDEQIQEHLRQHVPEYMVPTRFVLHDKLPLSDNGKIDRKALKAAADRLTSGPVGADYVAPSTPQEQRFVDILSQVIGIERVSVEANFFEIGANSIHLVKIQKRVKEDLGIEVAVTDLFRYPSVRALTQHLDKAGQGDLASDLDAARERAAKRATQRPRRNARDVSGMEEAVDHE